MTVVGKRVVFRVGLWCERSRGIACSIQQAEKTITRKCLRKSFVMF